VVTAIVTLIPALLYSGVLIPIQSLSGEAQVIARLLPAMYYTEIVLGSFLKATGPAEMWSAAAVLTVYALALLGIGFAMFSKRPSS
jgi:ABC-2 type transport system permease protein/ribosome-dependent ATPase